MSDGTLRVKLYIKNKATLDGGMPELNKEPVLRPKPHGPGTNASEPRCRPFGNQFPGVLGFDVI